MKVHASLEVLDELKSNQYYRPRFTYNQWTLLTSLRQEETRIGRRKASIPKSFRMKTKRRPGAAMKGKVTHRQKNIQVI